MAVAATFDLVNRLLVVMVVAEAYLFNMSEKRRLQSLVYEHEH